MAISELGRRENYVGEKYLIESYKDIQKNILKTSNVLKNYGVSTPLKDVVVKNYYDTDDLFFRKLVKLGFLSNKGSRLNARLLFF